VVAAHRGRKAGRHITFLLREKRWQLHNFIGLQRHPAQGGSTHRKHPTAHSTARPPTLSRALKEANTGLRVVASKRFTSRLVAR
jgi:hypothetical protein